MAREDLKDRPKPTNMPSAVSSKTSSPLRPSPLPPLHEDFTIPSKREFDVVKQYSNILSQENKAHPVAAIEALAELVAESESRTVQELLTLLHDASSKLAAASFNPISLTCGTSLFLRFLTLQRPPPSMSFTDFKRELVETAKDFVKGSGKCRELIAENTLDFIREGSVRLTSSEIASTSLADLRSRRPCWFMDTVRYLAPIVLSITECICCFHRSSGCSSSASRCKSASSSLPGLRHRVKARTYLGILRPENHQQPLPPDLT